ncbi:MAG: hypothetical protein ABI442_17905 [Gemmatimonadaceae bacterium]
MAEQDNHEETYDDERARRLESLLRELAERIVALDQRGKLLDKAGELLQRIGDIRSELFHYEVRITYDTPEVAESRRIVRDAQQSDQDQWHKNEWSPERDENPES